MSLLLSFSNHFNKAGNSFKNDLSASLEFLLAACNADFKAEVPLIIKGLLYIVVCGLSLSKISYNCTPSIINLLSFCSLQYLIRNLIYY